MKAPDHFHSLRKLSLPRITAYHKDLLVHDRRIIRACPDTPFLHVTRDHGTYISMLMPADSYPPEGMEIPYLFGKANRWKILRDKGAEILYAERNHHGALLLHYDGKILRETTWEKARKIIEDYRQSIHRAWSSQGHRLAA